MEVIKDQGNDNNPLILVLVITVIMNRKCK